MSLFRRLSPNQRPDDSPDLSYMMGFVTTVGGISAWSSKQSRVGLVAGCGLGVLFGISGALIQSNKPENHEVAHQMALIGSVMFGGAMGYRAGANPYTGPGGSMLAALGGLSSAYHLAKWVEWRRYEQARIEQAERLLAEHYRLGGRGQAQQAPGLGAAGAAAAAAHSAHTAVGPPAGEPAAPGSAGQQLYKRVLAGGYPGGPEGPPIPPGGR